MELNSRKESKPVTSLQHDPNYLALSRMLARYQNLILLTPTLDEKIDAQLAPLQKKTQEELWSPLPFHRMKWLHTIEGARTILLKLEQTAQGIKVQRTKRDVVKDLAEKRMVIKRLRGRVEEIGREVESSSRNVHPPTLNEDDDSETMYDVLQQIRKEKQRRQDNHRGDEDIVQDRGTSEVPNMEADEANQKNERDALLGSSSTVRRRTAKEVDEADSPEGKTSGFSNLPQTEQSLLAASKEHEDITTSLLNMAAQLKQQARQFQFTLDQDKSMLDRALEGLDQNVSAMGLASKGMKTLQRMSEEQGFFGRLKLQLFIAGMWAVAILLVFAGPKLRF